MITSDGTGGKTFSTNMSDRMPKYPVDEAMLITHVAIKGVFYVATKE
jgi:hypothetical protein